MVEFPGTDGRTYGFNKATVGLLKDVSDSQHPNQTQITVGSTSVTVAKSFAEVIAALNA